MNGNPMFMYYVLFAFIIVFGVVVTIINLKQSKAHKNNYLEKYPNAVKVYPKKMNVVVAENRVDILMVDGERPAFDGNATYVKPGKSTLVVRYSSSRVGVLHKTVNTYTDNVSVEVDLEEGKEYQIYFDKSAGEFKIEEKA